MNIRQATPDDAAQLLRIYGPIVEQSPASFELTPPTEAEFAERISNVVKTHEWLVVEDAGELCGYAYATPHRAREAYRHSIETSVYVHENHHGQGIGKRLYQALFESLQDSDFHTALAGITLPNDASVALHESVGFKPAGVYKEIGFKYGIWHDVGWWQKPL